jgi:hypothetical protein
LDTGINNLKIKKIKYMPKNKSYNINTDRINNTYKPDTKIKSRSRSNKINKMTKKNSPEYITTERTP